MKRRSFLRALSLLIPATLLAPFAKAQPQQELPDELKIKEGFKGTFDDVALRKFSGHVYAYHFSNKGKKELVIFVFDPETKNPTFYKAMGYGKGLQPIEDFHMNLNIPRVDKMVYGPLVDVSNIRLEPPLITVTYSHA